jgi:hypothetical protein
MGSSKNSMSGRHQRSSRSHLVLQIERSAKPEKSSDAVAPEQEFKLLRQHSWLKSCAKEISGSRAAPRVIDAINTYRQTRTASCKPTHQKVGKFVAPIPLAVGLWELDRMKNF